MIKEELKELLNDDEVAITIQSFLTDFGEQFLTAEDWHIEYNPVTRHMEDVCYTVSIATVLNNISVSLAKIAAVLGD